MIFNTIRVSIIGLLCSMAIWQSLIFRTGGFVPNDFFDEFAEVQIPKPWQRMHPDQWIQLSKQMLEADNQDAAHTYALTALKNNITSGGASSQLLHIYEKKNDIEKADKIALLTESLWPTHTTPRAHLADYWAKRGNLEKMLQEWNILLIKSSRLDKELFPHLANFLSSPSTTLLLEPYVSSPPKWWERFFSYLIRNQENIGFEKVQNIYQSRLNSEVPITERERRDFVSLLIKKKYWQDAYFAWLSGLSRDELTHSGLLFDGNFESDTTDTGFDWHFSKNKLLKVEKLMTYGMKGKKALSIKIKSTKRLNFRHIKQNLLLSKGKYTLTGRYRLDQLKTAEGLRWRIRCMKSNQILGESEVFNGRKPWLDFQFSFQVPENTTQEKSNDCQTQYIRLEASSSYAHKQFFQGQIWFDAMAITRQANKNDSL